jgi:hypothetical protein
MNSVFLHCLKTPDEDIYRLALDFARVRQGGWSISKTGLCSSGLLFASFIRTWNGLSRTRSAALRASQLKRKEEKDHA